ncbi:hemolysin family protein [Halobellus ordinarius]|uniref:hemolysin family protein n=1 Tax=Halobellus ordinarius TaxID=3075120 RepID=UPI0028801A8D|nr:CNNM domain-containing protein [Halobellus sp. ZY16]
MFALAQTSGTEPLAVVAGIIALLLISAFFSSSEIALFSIDDLFVASLVDDGAGDGRVAALRRLREDPHRLLVTILVGNNVVNIAIASIATTFLVDRLPAGYAVTASTVVVSVLVLVVGEISPKSYGVANAESWALRVARPLEIVQTVLYPLVAGFELVTRGATRLTGGSTDYQPPAVTRAEIEALVASAERAGTLHAGERGLIDRALEFSGTAARDVMTPRARVTAIDTDTTVGRAIRVCADHRVRTLPVYEGSLDSVVGAVTLLDLVGAIDTGGRNDADDHDDDSDGSDDRSDDSDGSDDRSDDSDGSDDRSDDSDGSDDRSDDNDGDPGDTDGDAAGTVASYLRPILSSFGDRAVDGVLRDLRAGGYEMAVLRDSSGGVEGVLTTEAVVDELLGGLADRGTGQEITRSTEGAVITPGDATLEDVVGPLGVTLSSAVAASASVLSLLREELGRQPVTGDVVRVSGMRLTVGAVDGDSDTRVRIEADPGPTEGDGPEG